MLCGGARHASVATRRSGARLARAEQPARLPVPLWLYAALRDAARGATRVSGGAGRGRRAGAHRGPVDAPLGGARGACGEARGPGGGASRQGRPSTRALVRIVCTRCVESFAALRRGGLHLESGGDALALLTLPRAVDALAW